MSEQPLSIRDMVRPLVSALFERVSWGATIWCDGVTDVPSALEQGFQHIVQMAISQAEMERNDALAKVKRLTAWLCEAMTPFILDGSKAVTLEDCLGLVRMCHEGAAALKEVERLNEIITKYDDRVIVLLGQNEELRDREKFRAESAARRDAIARENAVWRDPPPQSGDDVLFKK